MIRVKNIKLRYKEDRGLILERACKKLRLNIKNVKSWRIFKESLDVRKKEDIFYIYTVDVEADNEEKIIKSAKSPDVVKAEYVEYVYPKGNFDFSQRPVIVGFGPAGMFAALILSRMGARPLVLERGREAGQRLKDIDNLMEKGELNKESNIQFGEGGAGTFSDGKLTTRIKDPRSLKVMEEFVKHGAPEEILYSHNPHIGTDRLVDVVKNIRREIIENGGEVRFESRVTDLIFENSQVKGIVVNGNEEIKCRSVVLCVGHSARDTFERLFERGVSIEAKPFAIGCRIEHSQELINKAQYGSGEKAEYFGPAEYKLTYTAKNGRGVYTFCMCPGGYVVPAASEEGMVCVNGMSYYARDGKFANSALLVQVFPQDFENKGPLGGMYFQREIEKKAFEMGGGGYGAPTQYVGSFMGYKNFSPAENMEGTYRPRVKQADLNKLFPEYITEAMREAIEAMGRKVKGFNSAEALLIAPECRSSSPVRILRDSLCQSVSVRGLFPAGEGAGYAGGIVSAAVDGIRAAEMVCESLKKE